MPKRLLSALAMLIIVFSVQAQVVINEFMASNEAGYVDEDGEFSDWIELHNPTGSPITLDNWSLTDDQENLKKWQFFSLVIPANGYLVVHSSGKNRISGPRLHTSFSLSATGEYLALVRPDGTVAQEFLPQFPEQFRDVSYGYNSNRTEFVYFTVSTPGAANSGGSIGFVADTKFSHDRGFYTNAFDLTITTATSGAIIRYTTNGIPPTATTGILYTGAIRIAHTTTLRAAAFKTGFQPSNADTHTYLFLDDVIRQSPTGSPPPGWPSSWGANTVDYGMDPEVVNNPLYRDTIKNDLKTLPSVSVVMRLADMFDASTGIYANPGQDGRDWERQCSLELINSDGSDGFQVNAGIRIRGGFSRSTSNPKHALRFFFREEYGDSKLNYPIHGEGGTDSFDALDFRTFQNYSWSFQGDANGVFLRDQFSRDTQLEMGHNAERGNFFHLYLNGQYWGIYNSCERPEAKYGETYFGGDEEDYDVIKVEAGGYNINATDGNMTAWNALYAAAQAGFSTVAAYQKVQGNNPDGTPNVNYPVLLDIPNLIDYMLVIIYGGNLDAPISNFLGNDSPNNWYGMRNRNPAARMGFKFFAHDSEHTLLPWMADVDRTGPFSAGDTSNLKSNPQWIFQKLWANPEFRLKTADHIHRHFFNGGALTPEKSILRFMTRKNQIDRAVVAESARWGDAKRSTPMTRNVEWVSAINNVVNNFFPGRSDTVLDQLKSKNLYPNLAAPSFSQLGGNVNSGFQLSMTVPAGTIYYTLDGSDPRLAGGGISAAAIRYSSPVRINESLTVKARTLSGTTWSALNEAEFTIIRTFRELMVTELMYNPASTQLLDGEEFEFVELKNVGSQALDLSGISFANGISYTFPRGSSVAPGGFVVLVKNREAFQSRYPGVQVDGVYTNQLSNSGEAITFVHASGGAISDFTYSDSAPWPISADGAGFSLVPIRAEISLNLNSSTSWRASSAIGGSPGRDDLPANITPVYINEVLSHTDLPALDAVELSNPGTNAADISHWYLSDDAANQKKYQFRAGTIINPGAYLVLTEQQFNQTPGSATSFSFNSTGDDVYLFSANAAGELTGFIDGFNYGAAPNGFSFGRYANSLGEISHPLQKTLTLGDVNSGPLIGPVVLNEIQYAPEGGGVEFIEVRNIIGSTVKFYDPENPTNRWWINGIGFEFPAYFELPANGIVLIVGVDPVAFRARYSIPENVQIFGPFEGNLQDGGEMIQVLRPDAPNVAPGGSTVVPFIVVDAVRYDDQSPWPALGTISGSSLEKINSSSFGNDPANWRQSPGPASPGIDNNGNRPPIIVMGADQAVISAQFPVAVNLSAVVTDDGQPQTPGQISYNWTQLGGPGVAQFVTPTSNTTSVQLPGIGLYTLQLMATDGEFQSAKTVQVAISRPMTEVTLINGNARWKFLDNGSTPPSNWKLSTFNDTSWNEGAPEFGYGDGDETTSINFGPDASQKYPTTYFRHNFNVSNPRAVTRLTGKLLRDDGAIVYVNGVEVYRSNMPEGDVAFGTFASNTVGGGEEATFYENEIDPSVMVQGVNTIAIEVHQSNGTSTDLSFNFQLVALTNPFNQPPTASAGPDLAITLPAGVTLNGSASDDALPNPPGVFTATWSMVNGPGSVSFANPSSPVTTATFTTPGSYVLKLSVTDGELSAQDQVAVEVAGAVDAFAEWKNAHFNPQELSNSAISGESADPDGDGFTNRDEYIAGTNPRDAASFLHVQTILRENNDAKVIFEAAAEKSYSIQVRESLGTGEWESILDLSPQAQAAELIIRDAIVPEKPKKFYRVVTPQQREP